MGVVEVNIAGVDLVSAILFALLGAGIAAAVTGLLIASPYISVDAPLWPLGIALALLALSVIFRQGARLQRDTEGLV